MVGSDFSHEELELFRQDYREAIEGNIEILITGQTEDPLEVDTFSLGLGEESLAELDPGKINIIKDELNKLISRSEQTQPASSYESGDEEHPLTVSVFEGQRPDSEGKNKIFFLHEINHQDGSQDWQLSATPDPLL